jgi:tRNA(Ile)-lysidine synthase
VEADFELVEHLRLRPGVLLTLKPGLRVCRHTAGDVQIEQEKPPPGFDHARVELELGKSGMLSFAGLMIDWRIDSAPGAMASRPIGRKPMTKSGEEFFDADKVGATIALRHWQPGDRFHPIGLPESVKLQDLFTNQKVPQAERRRRTLAATASGELFWVEGLRISERFKLDEKTVRRLNWHWKAC